MNPPASTRTRRALRLLGALALLGAAGCAGPEPLVVREATQGLEPAPFLAGYGEAAFTPEKGYPLGGYGGGARRDEFPFWLGLGWPGRLALAAHQAWHEDGVGDEADLLVRSEGVHEEVGARALVLRPEQAPPLALVRIDAIGVTAEVHDQVVAGVADLGYRPETVLLAATHTHSGPGAFFRAPFAALVAMDNFRPELEARISGACVAAIRSAHATARPAALGFAEARDRGLDGQPVVAVNRRSRRFRGEIAHDALDDAIGLILVMDAASEAPLALLVNYAVHPTVLGPDNLHFSRDLAGGIEEALGARLGAPALFFNGAEGDVGPSRVRAGGGLLRCNEVGQALADLVLPALRELPLSRRLRVRAAWGTKELGSPFTCLALGRERFVDGDSGAAAWATAPLTLPLNLVLWTLGFTNVRLALSWNLGLGVVLHLNGLTGRTETRLAAVRLETERDQAVLLTFPGEPTHDVGLAAKAQARARGPVRPFVVGLGLDHVGYLASRTEYLRGGYEAWSTLFGPDAAADLVEAQGELLGAVGLPAPAPEPGR